VNHQEAQQLLVEPVGRETEEQVLFRRERAARLLGLAQQRGSPVSLRGISIEQLSLMHPAFAVAKLGLPPSVLLDEMRRLQPAPGPLLPGR